MRLAALIAWVAAAGRHDGAWRSDGGVVDSPTKEAIRARLHDARHDVRRCWESAGRATGKLTIRLVVQRDGSPASVSAETNGPVDEKLSACVVGVVEKLRFAALADGPIHIVQTTTTCGGAPR